MLVFRPQEGLPRQMLFETLDPIEAFGEVQGKSDRPQSKTPTRDRTEAFGANTISVHSTLIDLNDLRLIWTRIALDNRPISQMLTTMTRRELFVFRQVPQDVIRATPLMLLGPLPGTFLLFPLFFAYPRFFLTRQFWTGEQRAQFDQSRLDQRMTALPDLILDDLQRRVTALRAHRDTSAVLLQHLDLLDEIHEKVNRICIV
ncbi:unnamed protein product [Echinostoma caproni]|uniref:LETM1 domain-containing protein n=1 Tax=Echinostoma caproni TaxID=27848 RepID=A0A183AVA7_9TREM|nr:unnamed protein product [Echinostoma caproni]